MDIYWCIYKHLIVISHKRGVLHVYQPIRAVSVAVREEGERNPQPWADAHKKNNGGTTGQGVHYTNENNSNKQLAIKVNMSLTRS